MPWCRLLLLLSRERRVRHGYKASAEEPRVGRGALGHQRTRPECKLSLFVPNDSRSEWTGPPDYLQHQKQERRESRPWGPRRSRLVRTGDRGLGLESHTPAMRDSKERKPVWQLLQEAAQTLAPPFTVGDVLDWFAEHYPDVPAATIRAQVSALTGNNQKYLVHPTYSQRPPILWRVDSGQFERYDIGRHGEPSAALGGDEAAAPAEPVTEERQPVWRLLERASRELVSPFSVQDVIDWFADHYPEIPATTVRTQMSMLAGNSPAYRLHATYSTRAPVLMRVERGIYEPYDKRRHGEVTGVGSVVTDEAEDAVEAVQEFVLEQYLEEFLAANWGRIDFGRELELWSPDDRSARQFDASPAGRIDFLCRDAASDALVVVELKRGTPPRRGRRPGPSLHRLGKG